MDGKHDVLVVGAGLAGMRAAIAAHDAGADVALVSKLHSSHAAPAQHCRCGIYATHTPQQAAALLQEQRFARANRALQAVLGRVFLWGSVVECERGWRAERAYPAALYLPALARKPSSGRLGRLLRGGHESILPTELAQGLAAYGVQVELIACRTVTQLAEKLAADPDLSLEGAGG